MLKQVITNPQYPTFSAQQYPQPAHSNNYQYGHIQGMQQCTRPTMQGTQGASGGNQFSFTQAIYQDRIESNDSFQ